MLPPAKGRDHIVNIQSGESVLVVVNVHLVLKDLRERPRRISLH